MQYAISNIDPDLDVAAVLDAITALDPAALVDRDGDGGTLRVATVLPASQLSPLLSTAGVPVDASQIALLPSECCGGCGG